MQESAQAGHRVTRDNPGGAVASVQPTPGMSLGYLVSTGGGAGHRRKKMMDNSRSVFSLSLVLGEKNTKQSNRPLLPLS